MISIVGELEKLEAKLFQFFPLRTSLYPKYIPIDSKSLLELFSKDKANVFKDIENKKNEIWNEYFKLDHQVFRSKEYEFANLIMTDGYAVSIIMIKKSDAIIKKEKSIYKNKIKKDTIKE